MLKKKIKAISVFLLIIGYFIFIIFCGSLITSGWPTKKIIVTPALEAYEQTDYSLHIYLWLIWGFSIVFILAGLILESTSKAEYISIKKRIKNMFKETRGVLSFVIDIMAVYFIVLVIFNRVNWSKLGWWLLIFTASLLLLLSRKLKMK